MNCEDDACTKVDYYDNVIKYAPDLFNECGGDITDCEVASRCLPSDHKCSISYCDKNNSNDTCEPETQNNNPVNSLQNDNINDSNI